MLWKSKICEIQCLLIYPGYIKKRVAHTELHTIERNFIEGDNRNFQLYDVTFRRPFAILDDLKGIYNPLFK